MQQFIIPLALAALVLAILLIRQSRGLLIDPAYGCLTRHGLARRWTGTGAILFFDIDGMRELNKRHGYAVVDHRIGGALAATCRAGEAVAARWASGDELVIWLTDIDLVPLVLPRLHRALAERGLSAMVAAAPAERDLVATVARASALVLAQKRRRDAALGEAVAV